MFGRAQLRPKIFSYSAGTQAIGAAAEEADVLISLNRGFPYPNAGLLRAFYLDYTIDAATEKIAHIGRVYLQGRSASSKTISAAGGGSISFMTNTVTFANAGTTVDIGIQDISATGNPGQPDGTFDVKATFTGGGGGITTTAWNTCSMTGGTGSKTISHGQHVAIVWDMTARGGADSIIIRGLNNIYTTFITNAQQAGIQPGVVQFNGGTWQVNDADLPNAIITFDDGTLGYFDCGGFFTDNTTEDFSDATNPDERGLIFQTQFTCKVDAFMLPIICQNNTTSDFTVTLYSDPLGTPTSLKTFTINAEQFNVGTFFDSFIVLTLDTEVSLTRNTDYCLAVKAAGTGVISLSQVTLGSANYRVFFPGGSTVKKATRNNSTGSFTAESPAITQYGMCVRVSAINQ